MKVIIIGAGKVGIQIAQTLLSENHDVIIVDKREEIKQDLDSHLDIMTIIGNGANVRVLEQAGIRNAGMLIAVTQSDEVNMIACITAKQFEVKKTIARIRNSEYMYEDSLSKEKMGIDFIINPENSTALEIIGLLKAPVNVCETQDFAGGKVSLFGVKVDEDNLFANKKIKDTNLGQHSLIAALFREDNLIIPNGEDEIYAGDIAYLITKKEDVTSIGQFCGRKNIATQNVIILGGSNIGVQTATLLNETGIKTKLIEIDKEKCEKISELLPQTLIINGDGTNIELLREEGIDQTDGFVSVTGFDEDNLLTALLAKHLGAKKVIAKISKTNYIPILENIGIDAVVNPQLITAAAILRLLKHGELIDLALLQEGEIEVVEFIAQKNRETNNKPLKTLNLPDNTIIGAIVRDKETIIPHGEDVIISGDKVIIFTKPAETRKIEHLFL
ncbi:MAG: Trk system potassium transporter TrkA [Candidatus Atribacteria bacterium]|nr:Trk system potassium transporter TrkA [Candidatus Atribacteria bacterium]